MFGYNRKLQALVLVRNDILECSALAFHEENDFSYLDISRNRDEKLEGLTFSRLKILNIFQEQFTKSSFKSFINLKEVWILFFFFFEVC